ARRLVLGSRSANGPDRRLQVAIHSFCFCASVLRLIYLAIEALLVHKVSPEGWTVLQNI
ncbi:unnamed protein product, partial [Polarella glacialis]